MTESNDEKRCLILIPRGPNEPDWDTIITLVAGWNKIIFCKDTQDHSSLGHSYYCDENNGDKALFVYVLNELRGNLTRIINNCKSAKELFLELHPFFYDKKDKVVPVDDYKQSVLCGHFNNKISEVREFFREALKKATNDDKKKLRNFEDPVMGRGNFIIDSYTLRASEPWYAGATDLINKFKEASITEEKVKGLFSNLFDFFWYQHKLPELICNMQGQLFAFWHSKGKSGKDEFKASIEEFKKNKGILEKEFKINEDLSMICKVIQSPIDKLNQEEIKEVQTQFDRILLAILKKRDGENLQQK